MIRAAVELFSAAPVADADLRLEALQRGDVAVVQEVLTELLPRVRGWLFRWVGPDAELDDVTQESLTEIALALGDYQGRSSLAAYAYRICSRVAARHLKQMKRRKRARMAFSQQAHQVPPASEDRDPERRAMQRQALAVAFRCLQKLPFRRREAFVLCELEGLSPAEAAELAGTSASAMRSRLMHARSEMARLLGAGNAAVGPQKGEVP